MIHSQKAFKEIYGTIQKVLPYDPKWLTHGDYFHGSVEGIHAVHLNPGERAKTEAPYPDCRRIIFVGTNIGTMAVFERLRVTPSGDRSQYILQCTGPGFKRFPRAVVHGAMTSEEITTFVGKDENSYNIGKIIALLSLDTLVAARQVQA